MKMQILKTEPIGKNRARRVLKITTRKYTHYFFFVNGRLKHGSGLRFLG